MLLCGAPHVCSGRLEPWLLTLSAWKTLLGAPGRAEVGGTGSPWEGSFSSVWVSQGSLAHPSVR